MEYTQDDLDSQEIQVFAHTKKGWLTYNDCEWNLYLRVGSKYGTQHIIEHHLVLADNLYHFEIKVSEEEEEELQNGLDYDHPIVQSVSKRICAKLLM